MVKPDVGIWGTVTMTALRKHHLDAATDEYVAQELESPSRKGSDEEAHEHLKVVSRRYNVLSRTERFAIQASCPNFDPYRWATVDEWEQYYWMVRAFYASAQADRTRFEEHHLTPRRALTAILADRFGDRDGCYLMGSPALRQLCRAYGI